MNDSEIDFQSTTWKAMENRISMRLDYFRRQNDGFLSEAATAMLDTLQPGDTMLLRLYRKPHPLYKALLRQGHSYRTELLPDGTFDILITRGTATQPPA